MIKLLPEEKPNKWKKVYCFLPKIVGDFRVWREWIEKKKVGGFVYLKLPDNLYGNIPGTHIRVTKIQVVSDLQLLREEK